MITMKRMLIGLLTCLLALGTLLGCRKTEPAAKATAEPQKTEAATAEPTPETTAEPTAEPTPEPYDPITEIDTAVIGNGKHEREEGYKDPFKTRLLDTPLAAVHLEDGEQYSDETLRVLAKIVTADILAVVGRTGETPEKVTLYIVWNLQQDRPILLGDHLICSAEQVQSGVYREAMIGAAFDLPIVWKQVGLDEIVFGAPDDGGLKDYYADEAHALVASCAAVYFVHGFADEETVEAARQTAASITTHLLETGGFDALRAAADTAEILPAWAALHEIGTNFTLPDGHGQAAAMTAYRNRKPGVLCVMQCLRYTIDIRDGSFVGTPDEAYDFVCRFLYGAKIVLDQIREESPTLWETAERRAREPIYIHLVHDETQRGISYGNVNEIKLVYMSPVWHELVHALLMKWDGTLWINEAIAEHFSRRARSFAIPFEEYTDFTDWYRPDTTEVKKTELAFWKACWNIYLAERGEDAWVPPTLYSDRAVRRAFGIAELILSDDPTDWGQDPSVGAVAGRKTGIAAEDGNALSYYEATVLLEYLFETYGTETVAAGFMNGASIEEICGKPYAELYRDCTAYYTERYGDLIGAEN